MRHCRYHLGYIPLADDTRKAVFSLPLRRRLFGWEEEEEREVFVALSPVSVGFALFV